MAEEVVTMVSGSNRGRPVVLIQGRVYQVDRSYVHLVGNEEVWSGRLQTITPRNGNEPFRVFVPCRRLAGMEVMSTVGITDYDLVLGVEHQEGVETCWNRSASRWSIIVYWEGITPSQLDLAEKIVALQRELSIVKERCNYARRPEYLAELMSSAEEIECELVAFRKEMEG